MRLRKLTAVIAASLIFFCSCSDNAAQVSSDSGDKQPDTYAEVNIQLPFSAADSLNPYVAVTKVNQELSMLLYDPLIKLSEEFEPVYYIAESAEYESGKVTVTLKDICFTDGTTLTASDVQYSFNQAVKTENKYKAQLESISSCTVSDSKTVVFNLVKADPYAVNLLDFPIFKSGTAETKDSNDRVIPPVGCGRYTFDKSDGYKLTANESYYGDEQSFSTVFLIDTPDDESLTHMIEVNAIDMAYSDLSDNNIPKMLGTQKAVPLTNIVFLGLNKNSNLLAKPEMRAAISTAVSRSKIAESAYFNFAAAATGIFPSFWSQAKDLQHISSEQNIEQAVAYLEQLGYNSKDNDGYYVDNSGNRLTFSLLYNKGNSSRKYAAELISQQLKKAGIEITIEEADSFDDYSDKITNGRYDIYIGEIKLGKSMDLRSIFSEESIYGLSETYTAEMLSAFYDGTADLSTVISAFVSEMPLIPICCRQGVFVYSNIAAENPKVSLSDIYADL